MTWKAWHFGIPFRMTSKITEYERPRHFVDEQTRGPFASWRHEHRFERIEAGTRMVDVVDYRSPLGPIGSLVDSLRLERYMVELFRRRNDFLRVHAENDDAKQSPTVRAFARGIVRQSRKRQAADRAQPKLAR